MAPFGGLADELFHRQGNEIEPLTNNPVASNLADLWTIDPGKAPSIVSQL